MMHRLKTLKERMLLTYYAYCMALLVPLEN